MTIPMPVYELTPLCGDYSEDIQYELLTFNGDKVPDDWIWFEEGTHEVKVDLVDDFLEGQEIKFKMVATFSEGQIEFVKEVEFTIVLPKIVKEE